MDSEMISDIQKFPNCESGAAFESGKDGCPRLIIWEFQNIPIISESIVDEWISNENAQEFTQLPHRALQSWSA